MAVRFVNEETRRDPRADRRSTGDFPMMTDRGTFVIHGTERVVVTQLVRSTGRLPHGAEAGRATKSRSSPPTSCPSRGSWLELEVDKKGAVVRPHRPQAQVPRDRAAARHGVRLERRDPKSLHRLRLYQEHGRPRHDVLAGAGRSSVRSSAPASHRPLSSPPRCARSVSSTPSATNFRASAARAVLAPGTATCRRQAHRCLCGARARPTKHSFQPIKKPDPPPPKLGVPDDAKDYAAEAIALDPARAARRSPAISTIRTISSNCWLRTVRQAGSTCVPHRPLTRMEREDQGAADYRRPRHDPRRATLGTYIV